MHKLEVYHDGATVEYEASVLEDVDYATNESFSGISIETSDIEVLIDGTFLGASNIFELPEDDGTGNTSWRARLLFGEPGDEIEVFSGVIRKLNRGITNREYTETWSVKIEDAAYDEFLDKIDSVRFLNSPDDYEDINATLIANLPADPYIVPTRVDGGSDSYEEQWFLIEKLWTAIIATAGDISFNHSNFFEYTIVYLATGFPREYERIPQYVAMSAMAGSISGASSPFTVEPTLPDWSGKDLFEALQVMLGWRAIVEYDAYPARTLQVDIIKDIWVQPSSPPDFTDDYEEEGDPEIWIESASNPDLGIAYANEYKQEDIIFPAGFTYSGSLPSGSEVHVGAAKAALYHAEEGRKFNAEGNPDNKTMMRIPFHHPHVNDIHVENVQPDPIGEPDYSEDVSFAHIFSAPDGKRGEAFIGAFQTMGGGFGTSLIQARTPDTPDEISSYTELWPIILLQNYEVSTKNRYVMALRVDLSDEAINSFRVGDPSGGIIIGSKDWMVRKKSIVYMTESIGLEVERPIDEPDYS